MPFYGIATKTIIIESFKYNNYNLSFIVTSNSDKISAGKGVKKMAKKVPITKVLSCFVVFVILMSAVPVSTFASSTGDNVKFRGVVTGEDPGLIGAIHWYVSVDEWISGSLSCPCDEIDVVIGMHPPFGSWDENISKGDSVEVCGVPLWSECTVGLNGESYYIKKISSELLSLRGRHEITISTTTY